MICEAGATPAESTPLVGEVGIFSLLLWVVSNILFSSISVLSCGRIAVRRRNDFNRCKIGASQA
jgi:hypothetical protein